MFEFSGCPAFVSPFVGETGWDCLPFSSVNSSCNSCAASARPCNRAHKCSSIRFSTNASGSSSTIGYSSSIASSNTSGESDGTKFRVPDPQAIFCRSSPRCPSRSVNSIFGRAASSRNLRIPQRLNVFRNSSLFSE